MVGPPSAQYHKYRCCDTDSIIYLIQTILLYSFPVENMIIAEMLLLDHTMNEFVLEGGILNPK